MTVHEEFGILKGQKILITVARSVYYSKSEQFIGNVLRTFYEKWVK